MALAIIAALTLFVAHRRDHYHRLKLGLSLEKKKGVVVAAVRWLRQQEATTVKIVVGSDAEGELGLGLGFFRFWLKEKMKALFRLPAPKMKALFRLPPFRLPAPNKRQVCGGI